MHLRSPIKQWRVDTVNPLYEEYERFISQARSDTMIIYIRDGCAWFDPAHEPVGHDYTLLAKLTEGLPLVPEEVVIDDIVSYKMISRGHDCSTGWVEFSVNVQFDTGLPWPKRRDPVRREK